MRAMRAALCGAAMVLAGQGLAQTSGQAAYNTAQAAFDKGDWSAAAAGFATLVPANRPLGHAQAVIAARLAFALVRQQRFAEASVYADRAIAALPESDTSNLSDALLTAGDAARFDFDYPGATRFYRRALAIAIKSGDKPTMLAARSDLAFAETTIDPAAVAADLDSVINDPAEVAALSKKDLAVVLDLRARAAMNAGDVATASRLADRAIATSGGLTMSVNVAQVAMRNDAAIISSLRKDDENTRKYLTYTGAGHLTKMDWIGRYQGELPVCGGEGDIRPDDSAVIQFGIADDGHVEAALPLYASRPGLIGATFARQVSSWQWNPDELKGVDPFWRSTLVLQLRCQTRPSPETLGKPVWEAFTGWLASRGVAAPTKQRDGYVTADDPRLAHDGAAAIPALMGRIDWRRSDSANKAMRARLQTILDASHAPPSAYALQIDYAANGRGAGSDRQDGGRARANGFAAMVPDFQQRYPADPSLAWLRLEWALALEDAADFRGALPLLRSVADTPEAVLADDAPVRRVALLHAAMATARLGDAGAAQADLARSGMSADQCSLFETHPIASSVSIASSAFPSEAMAWHFEGYVQEAYDITDDGHVDHIRTVVAYPPFVFAPTTERAVRLFRYIPPRIGSKAVGCEGETQGVAYRLP